jgi:hypothetical protein
METNELFVFLLAIPVKRSTTEKGLIIEDMVKDVQYVNQYIDGDLYRLYYEYFYSFSEAVVKLGRVADKFNDIAEIIEPGDYSTAKLILQIDSRRGYLYSVNDAFEYMLNIEPTRAEI